MSGCRWKSYDSAPKDGSMFLLLLPKHMNLIVRCKYDTVHKHFSTDQGRRGITAVHFIRESEKWQPMPDLPKDSKQ